jgi:hypothetical protein
MREGACARRSWEIEALPYGCQVALGWAFLEEPPDDGFVVFGEHVASFEL